MTERDRSIRDDSPRLHGRWFDAHLDLAFLAETGRDMHVAPARARGRYTPAGVTLPELQGGNVRACLGTIFTQPVPDPSAPDAETGPFTYDPDDTVAAYVAGMRQLKLYQAWASAGVIDLMPRRGQPCPLSSAPLRVGVLLEGADPIETPEQAGAWGEQGVIAAGLTWRLGSRYADGDAPEAPRRGGLTDAGRAMVDALDDAGIVHDLSHLSQEATEQVLARARGPVMISHTNCRSLLEDAGRTEGLERFASDETIAEVGRRGGVVGVTLLSSFLIHPLDEVRGERAPIAALCDHVEKICDLHGHRRGVGLGSDTDGGVTALALPQGIDTIASIGRLGEALSSRGWSDDDVHAFAWGNWSRFWSGDGAAPGA